MSAITGEMIHAAAVAIAEVRFCGALSWDQLNVGEQTFITEEALAALRAALA